MKRAAIWLLAGCGRIGFDATSVDATSGDAGCTFGPFGALTPVAGMVNSSQDDWDPAPARGGLDLYFFSFRNGSLGSDIWRASRPSLADPFGAAMQVPELNTAGNELAVAVSDDALDVIFSRQVGGATSDLFEAARTSGLAMFSSPVPLTINSATADNDPFLSADGLRLVFASSRIGPDQHGLDLFETTRPDRGSPFATPIALAELDTDVDDFTPALSADGLEIFFASRRATAGDADIYTARRPAIDQPFSPPARVTELSSGRDDVHPHLSLDGTTIYLDYNTLTSGGANADFYTAVRSCQ